MGLINTITVLVCLSAVFSYLNVRFIKLPIKIGLMAIALAMSLALVVLGKLGVGLPGEARAFVEGIDFNATLLHGMLSFLLFAGALHVNLDDLLSYKWFIGTVATAGVVLSTGIVGILAYFLFGLVGLDLPFIDCLLFGALISPTDPIAVVGILKQIRVPKSLEIRLTGESLFNDGVGVVVFLALLGVAINGEATPAGVALLLVQEALGGAALGFAMGYAAYLMLKSVDNYQVEILVTLALVMGGYALANALHTSGPIAVVIAGLLIGNHGRRFAMSDTSREHLDSFWELIDELLNAILFVLIGLEVLVLSFQRQYLQAGLVAIPIVLFARCLSVGLPVRLFSLVQEFSKKATIILTWGGLRGGISVALALSLPPGHARNAIVTVTYAVVAFSIIVQGLTIGRVIRSASVAPESSTAYPG
ncbi:MAG: cation:proton antiporter [Candidatus Methylomirabilales bacterium]